MYKTLKATCN